MTLSTPASPTPETEDGDDLLLELRAFLSSASTNPYSSTSIINRNAATALRLLRRLPAAKEAVLEFFSGLVDASIAAHLCEFERANRLPTPVDNSSFGNQLSRDELDLVNQSLSDLKRQLSSFLVTNGSGWGWCISRWAITQLGDMSAKYSLRLVKISGVADRRGDILNTLPLWLSMEGARTVIELTTMCIDALKDYHDETERCVSVLLDTSVKHGANFDWAVAHVGGCFPDTIITRVLSVGIKDFVSGSGDDQKISDSQSMNLGSDGIPIHLSREPKMSSVAGILGHLATAHQANLRNCLRYFFEIVA